MYKITGNHSVSFVLIHKAHKLFIIDYATTIESREVLIAAVG